MQKVRNFALWKCDLHPWEIPRRNRCVTFESNDFAQMRGCEVNVKL